MNILLISPLGFAINEQTRYAGIEKLVWQYSQELVKHNKVTVLGHSDSVFPMGVVNLGTKSKADDIFILAEVRQYQSYHYILRQFDVIHDFSHQHFASRYNFRLPSLNLFWHAPSIAQYPKSPYNIIAPSEWAAREFKRVYKQEARYQQSIVVDYKQYHPLWGREEEIPTENRESVAGNVNSRICPPSPTRGDRFLTMGIMTPQKGNLATIMLCKDLDVPLDVVGGRGAERQNDPLTDYEKAIRNLCDGELIKFHGEVTEEEKIKLLQTCKALIYITPDVYTEVTSQKVQEVMFCGAPIITTAGGAMPEIVTHGVNGFLCNTEEEYKQAIKDVDTLKPEGIYKTQYYDPEYDKWFDDDPAKSHFKFDFEGNTFYYSNEYDEWWNIKDLSYPVKRENTIYQEVVKKYSIDNVCAQYMELYSKVKEGLRW